MEKEATSRNNTHGEGTFNFQTAIVMMKCCFCPFFLVLFRWIVIFSVDIRLGVIKRGFYFSLKKWYSPFNIEGLPTLCTVLRISGLVSGFHVFFFFFF